MNHLALSLPWRISNLGKIDELLGAKGLLSSQRENEMAYLIIIIIIPGDLSANLAECDRPDTQR